VLLKSFIPIHQFANAYPIIFSKRITLIGTYPIVILSLGESCSWVLIAIVALSSHSGTHCVKPKCRQSSNMSPFKIYCNKQQHNSTLPS